MKLIPAGLRMGPRRPIAIVQARAVQSLTEPINASPRNSSSHDLVRGEG